MTPCRIVIIAKAPLPGYCKTRLIPALGPEGAAALATRMLRRTVETALDARTGAVEVCAAPNAAHPLWSSLQLPAALDWSDQGEGDLGQRMERAAERTLARREHVVLIGTDCPALTAAHLRDATMALQRGEAALIPVFDGGYALLGLATMHAALFNDMPWSTSAVARLTLERIEKAGQRVHMGPRLYDIDDPEDLAHLPMQWSCSKPITPQDTHAV